MNFYTTKEIGVVTIRLSADGSGGLTLDFGGNGETSRIITGFRDGDERRIGEEIVSYAHDMFRSCYGKV